MNLINIEKLCFSYPTKKDALKNISFKVEEGNFICIVGENGSGKSTLIKCILGLNKGYTGKIEREEQIGYLPQKTEIQSNFPASVEEVVMSGTIPNHVRSFFYKKEDKEKTKEVLKKLQIYDIRKKCFADLSGGQQQRVLIARAICATEKIIILDEPTNGLDPSIARQIYQMLDKLKKETNLSILMVSHDIDRALAIGVAVTSLTTGMNTDVCNFMFGSILAMSKSDVILSMIVGIIVSILFVIYYRKLFVITFDEDFAKASGLKVAKYTNLIAILTAVTIVIGMRMMGTMLISSIIIFPALTSMRIFKNFKRVVISSGIISVIAFLMGIYLSYIYSISTGAMIVLVNLSLFIIFSIINKIIYE